MVQYLGIHLPMQEIPVQSLVWEDLICHGAAKPVVTTAEPAYSGALFRDKRNNCSEQPASVQFSSVQSLSRVRLFATP